MSFESFLALRYLKTRNHSRFLSFMTMVAIGSVAIGTAGLILTYTILHGFERELRNTIIGFSSHIHVGTFRNQLAPYDPAQITLLNSVENVSASSPFLQREAIVITRDHIDGVVVKGLVSRTDVSSLKNRIVQGRYALERKDGLPSVILGKRLADKLALSVGDKLVLLGVTNMQDITSAPKVQCRISALYETGMAEYFDDLFVFVSLETSGKLFALHGKINGYDVLAHNTDALDRTTEHIQKALGYPFDPRTVFDIYRNIFVWIDLQKELIPVVVGSLILISVFNIIATLLLVVIEKTQDVGILKALGARQRSIRRVFLLQGLAIGVIGVLIGSVLAFAFSAAQQRFEFFSLPEDIYYMKTVPILLSWEVFALVGSFALVLSVLSSMIPAWLAARMNPIHSIRFH